MTLVFDAMTKPERTRVSFPADEVPLHICEIDRGRVGSPLLPNSGAAPDVGR